MSISLSSSVAFFYLFYFFGNVVLFLLFPVFHPRDERFGVFKNPCSLHRQLSMGHSSCPLFSRQSLCLCSTHLLLTEVTINVIWGLAQELRWLMSFQRIPQRRLPPFREHVLCGPPSLSVEEAHPRGTAAYRSL